MPHTAPQLGFLLPLTLLVVSWPRSAPAIGQKTTIPREGDANSAVAASNSIYGPDCIALEDEEKQPSPGSNNSADSSSGLDRSDGPLNELSADISMSNAARSAYCSSRDPQDDSTTDEYEQTAK